jgi:hypothetical protein
VPDPFRPFSGFSQPVEIIFIQFVLFATECNHIYIEAHSIQSMLPADSGRKRDTESLSFRLEKEDLDDLRELARSRKISLNSLVAQVLDRYLRLWVYDRSFGFFPVSKKTIRLAFAKLTPEEIREVADESSATIHKQIIMFLYGEVTSTSVIEYLDVFGTRFESYKHFRKGSKHVVTIFHDVSIEFSQVYYSILAAILALAQFKIIESERDLNENGFSISFDVRR